MGGLERRVRRLEERARADRGHPDEKDLAAALERLPDTDLDALESLLERPSPPETPGEIARPQTPEEEAALERLDGLLDDVRRERGVLPD